MRNYDEKAQCRFGDLVVEATVIGDSLMLCQTPWPGILFREGFCDTLSGAGCVLDVWVEISLNGFDFTIDSQVNFRLAYPCDQIHVIDKVDIVQFC